MMRLFLILCFLFVIQIVFGQDTLMQRNGQIKIVTVKEINTTDIKYIRFGTTNPLYIQSKKEVLWIKFKDGSIDSIDQSGKIPQRDLLLVNSRISNFNGPLTDNALWALLYHYPKPKVKEQLIFRYVQLDHLHKKRVALFVFGILAGYATYTGIFNYTRNTNKRITIGVIGAAVVGTSFCLFKFNEKKTKKKKAELVELYNNGL